MRAATMIGIGAGLMTANAVATYAINRQESGGADRARLATQTLPVLATLMGGGVTALGLATASRGVAIAGLATAAAGASLLGGVLLGQIASGHSRLMGPPGEG